MILGNTEHLPVEARLLSPVFRSTYNQKVFIVALAFFCQKKLVYWKSKSFTVPQKHLECKVSLHSFSYIYEEISISLILGNDGELRFWN